MPLWLTCNHEEEQELVLGYLSMRIINIKEVSAKITYKFSGLSFQKNSVGDHFRMEKLDPVA